MPYAGRAPDRLIMHWPHSRLGVIDGKLLTNDEAVALRMNLTYCLDVTYSRTGRMATDRSVMQIVNYGMLTEVGFYRLDEILASKR